MSGKIMATLENTDDFYYPRRSWLLVEGDIVNASDETRYQDANLITLTDNAIMHLFTNIKYNLCGMESLNHPLSSTTRLGLSKYSLNYAKGYALVGIQTDKSANQDHNASLFEHSNVVNTSVVLNTTKYPPLDANANFTKYQFAQFYSI